MDKNINKHFLSVDNIPEILIRKADETTDPNADPDPDPDDNDIDTISEAKTEIDLKDVENEFNYYHILRRVLYPFALTGAPIGFCLKDPSKLIKVLSLYGLMNIYSFFIGTFVHLICGFWMVRVAFHIFDKGTFTEQLWDEVFTLLYSLSGVVALDLMWLYRKSLRRLIFDLDKTPELDQTILMHFKQFKINYKLRLAFLTLFVISLFVLCLSYIAVVIVVAFNTDSETLWTDRIFSFIALYSLYVVLFVMVLYIAFCWIMKFKFEHLNYYVQTLKARNAKPDLRQLEIIKFWYRDNMHAVKKIDEIFNVFIFGYFVLLFFGIVTEVEECIAMFSPDANRTVQEVLITIAFIGLMMFSLFYTIKQTSDVTNNSANTKALLYDYVLSTNPEDRTAIYYEELQLMIPGLLSNPANLTLLGLVNLNSDFMAHAVVFIYTYTLLFKQFVSDNNVQLKNITKILNKE